MADLYPLLRWNVTHRAEWFGTLAENQHPTPMKLLKKIQYAITQVYQDARDKYLKSSERFWENY